MADPNLPNLDFINPPPIDFKPLPILDNKPPLAIPSAASSAPVTKPREPGSGRGVILPPLAFLNLFNNMLKYLINLIIYELYLGFMLYLR